MSSLWLAPARWAWNQRRTVASGVRSVGRGANWVWHALPLPLRVRQISREVTFGSIEHLIVQSEPYQQWLAEHGGTSRLHQLLSGTTISGAAAPVPSAPSADMWEALIEQRKKTTLPAENAIEVDIIVPVYKHYDLTLHCIYNVLTARTDIAYNLIVINDHSPDHKLSNKLQQLQEAGLFNLFSHDENKGFVATVNEGMQRHDARDVVLLNADALVYDDWLDRLRAAAYASEATASVTPLSNNAEICSYPHTLADNAIALELDYPELDALTAKANAETYINVPTAVGFCMYIRRDALQQIGYFDVDAFGTGYGEENDWCLRASAKGWHHVMATDIFVRHVGSASFGSSAARRIRKGLRVLNKRYPYYRDAVRSYIADDPARNARRRLDRARLRRVGTGNAMLMISHTAGGGTEKHIRDMARHLQAEGISCYHLSPAPDSPSHVALWHEAVADTPNLLFDIDVASEREALIDALRDIGVKHMHVHHLLGFAARMQECIYLISGALGAPYDVTMHDYYFVCPSINLVHNGQYFTGNPSLDDCEAWAKRHPSAAGRMPIWQWQYRNGEFLGHARRVFAPSEDTAQRIQHYFPYIDVYPRPHPEEPLHAPDCAQHTRRSDDTLHVAIIGALTTLKGARVVEALARDAKGRYLNIHYHVFGAAEHAPRLKHNRHVTVHGRYPEGKIYELLSANPCHLALLPSTWPETYSYTLSIAQNAGLYPVAFDMGAPAERIRDAGYGDVLPAELIQQPQAINDHLLSLEIPDAPDLYAANGGHYTALAESYYGGLEMPHLITEDADKKTA